LTYIAKMYRKNYECVNYASDKKYADSILKMHKKRLAAGLREGERQEGGEQGNEGRAVRGKREWRKGGRRGGEGEREGGFRPHFHV